MILEQVVLDETLNATTQEIEKLASQFFSRNICIPCGIDILTFEQDGDKQIWIVNPEDRSDGQLEKLINGYIEISPMSLDRTQAPTRVKIVSCRYEMTPFWYELGQYIKVSKLIPDLPVDFIVTPLSKWVVSGEVATNKEHINTGDKVQETLELPASVKILLPTTSRALKRWKKAYRAIKDHRADQMQEFNSGIAKRETPTVDELREVLIDIFHRKPSDRTVEKIIAAGDNGYLK